MKVHAEEVGNTRAVVYGTVVDGTVVAEAPTAEIISEQPTAALAPGNLPAFDDELPRLVPVREGARFSEPQALPLGGYKFPRKKPANHNYAFLKFTGADQLRGGSAPGPLSVHYNVFGRTVHCNVGLKHEHPRGTPDKSWKVIGLGVGNVEPLKVRIDGNYVVWDGPHGEMLLDVADWRINEGQPVRLAKQYCCGETGGPTRTSSKWHGLSVAGRDFVLQADGTIAPRTKPHLRLGLYLPDSVRHDPRYASAFEDPWLVLDGGVEGCPCLPGRCGGFHRNLGAEPYFRQVPPPLAARGVTWERWRHHMDKLQGVQDIHWVCDPCRSLVWVPEVWPFCFCPWSMADPFQCAMHSWLEDFNRELEPKGIFVKALTFKRMHRGATKGGDDSLATLTFAMTPEAIRQLKAEPVLQVGYSGGDPNEFCWCCYAHWGRAV